MNANVLIIEDDREIGELVGLYLQKEGITTTLCPTAEEGMSVLESGGFDLLVLDINLPGIDGFEALRGLRKKSNLPVVIVSARDTDEDLILGLGLGADDFVTKPFSPKVLAARVRAHLRRFYELKDAFPIRFGDFSLDAEGSVIKKNGKRVSIPPRELELLFLLVKNPGVTMTPEEIFRKVWGYEYGDVTTVAVHIQRLRRKIEENPASPKFIETIRGFGYRFNPQALRDQT